MDARRTRPLRVSAVLLLALAGACFPEPPKSLRTLMIEQELHVRALEKGAWTGDVAGLVQDAEHVVAVSNDDAFDQYASSPAVGRRAGEFRALRERYVQESDAVAQAARAGDRETLVAALSRLRATCDGCHAQFRPGL